QLVEAALLIVLGYGIHLGYVEPGLEGIYLPVILATALLANILLNAVRSHRIAAYRTFAGQMARELAAGLATIMILTVGIFFFKASDLLSRVWLLSWFVSGAVVLVAFRLLLRHLVQRWTAQGRLKRRTVIVGGGKD